MLHAFLDRFTESTWGTLGRLYLPYPSQNSFCYTLEEEGQQNQTNISRIPSGLYVCRRTIYHRHGIETFEVTDVPDRTRILFHVGNTEEDTDGCILLGEAVGPLEVEDEDTGKLRMKLGVIGSRPAFRRFMGALRGHDAFTLKIDEPEWRV